MGADSICVKDMAGLIAPYDAYAIVKALKAAVKPPSTCTAISPRACRP
jgi:pyruvate carboxylase subunit B